MAKLHRKRSGLKAKARGYTLRIVLDVLGIPAAILGAGVLAWAAITGEPHLAGTTGWVLALVVLALAPVLWLRLRTNRRERGIVRAGAEGEDQAMCQLARALPAAWHVFSNVTVTYEDHSSEMDLVAVGPAGVCVVEVKNYAGEVRGDAAAHDLTHVNHGRTEQIYNPIRQVGTHVHRLSGYLRQVDCGAWVRGFVYFVAPDVSVRLTGRGGAPWYPASRVKELVRDICRSEQTLDAAQIKEITAALKRL